MLKWLIPAAKAESTTDPEEYVPGWNDKSKGGWRFDSLPANDFDFDVVEDLYLNAPEEEGHSGSDGSGTIDFDSDSFDLDIGLF